VTAAQSGSATPFGGTLALVVAVVAGLAVGVGVGVGGPVPVTCGVLGALVLVSTARKAESDRPADRVGAGVGVLLTVGVFGTVPTLAGGGLDGTYAALVAGAVLFVGIDGLTRFFDGGSRDLTHVAIVSATVPVAVLGLSFVAWVGVLVARVALDLRAVSGFVLLVTLQIEVLLATVLLGLATEVVDDWTGWRAGGGAGDSGGAGGSNGAGDSGGPQDSDTSAAERFVEKLGAATAAIRGPQAVAVGGFLFVQLLLALGYPGLLERTLSSVPVLGPAVRTALEREWLHAPFDLLIAISVVVLAVEAVRLLVVAWAEPDPPETLGYATGSTALCALLVVVGLAPPTRAALASALPVVDPSPAVAVVVSLATLTAALVALVALVLLVEFASRPSPVPERSPGFALGAACLFLVAVGAGLGDTFPPVVFGTAAAAFVVWDVGDRGVELAATLGPAADTDRGEFVLAATTALVGVGAVVLGTLVLYVLGPPSMSVPAWRGYLALSLSLVALCSLALYLVRSSPEAA